MRPQAAAIVLVPPAPPAALERHWRWTILPTVLIVGLYVACHLAQGVADHRLASEEARMLALIALSLVPAVVVAAACLGKAGGGATSALALRGPAVGPTWPMVAWTVIVLLAAGGLAAGWLVQLAGQSATAASPGPLAQVLPGGVWAWVLLTVLVTPVCEEVVFRGYLFGRLRQGFIAAGGPLVLSSIVFGGLHLPSTPRQAATLLGMALVLGLLRARSGSVWPGVVVHAAWNAAVLGLSILVASLV